MFNDEMASSVKASALSDFQETYMDFMLSRQAMMCTERTLEFYRFTLEKVLDWLKENGISGVQNIDSKAVREYLSSMISRGLSDSYINSHARALRTFLRFLEEEEYIEKVPKFKMPTIAKKNLPVLNSQEVNRLLSACINVREQSLIMLMVDTGVRRKELCELNWGDVNLESGMVNVIQGKGRKSRSVVVGIKTRRILLKYKRKVDHSESSPLIQTVRGGRYSPGGLRNCLHSIGGRAGIHVSPHILRRTFATLSLRSGMNPLHLQGLLGHSSLEMTRRYVSMVDSDLLTAHQKFGPVDNL